MRIVRKSFLDLVVVDTPYAGITRVRFSGVDGILAALSAGLPQLPRYLHHQHLAEGNLALTRRLLSGD